MLKSIKVLLVSIVVIIIGKRLITIFTQKENNSLDSYAPYKSDSTWTKAEIGEVTKLTAKKDTYQYIPEDDEDFWEPCD